MQDAEGRAPIHVAISNQQSIIIQLLISHPDIRLNIRDRQGMTPFACAMTHKNNKAAEAILKRESGAAEQVRRPDYTYIQRSNICVMSQATGSMFSVCV